MKENIRKRAKIIIQYNCIPHYRANIFELLSNYKPIKFKIIADNQTDTPFLETITGDKKNGIRHVYARNWIIKIPKVHDIYWQPDVIRMILSERPNAIIALGSPYSLTAWVLLLLGMILKIPVFLWTHGLLGNESGPKWYFRKLFYNLATGLYLYGDHAKQILIKKGFSENKLHVVYNSLDYDKQLEVVNTITQDDIRLVRDNLGVHDNERLVIFTGRLTRIKKLEQLIKAAYLLNKKNHKVHIAFIGDGPERQNLHEMSINLGISKYVHFLGALYDEYIIGKMISASDLCVIPSGAGLSVMHSMVYGTPVLLHDKYENHFPEWEAVIDGSTGFFYRYNDIYDMVYKMELALFPLPMKRKMEEACRNMIKDRYNPHKQLEVFVEQIKRVV